MKEKLKKLILGIRILWLELQYELFNLWYERGTVRMLHLYLARRSRITKYVDIRINNHWEPLDGPYESLFRQDGK